MNDRDVPELDPELRALIGAARDMHEPNAEVQRRVLNGLELKLAAGVTTTAALGSWFTGTAKAMLAVAALGVVSAGVWVAQRPEPKAAPMPVAAQVEQQVLALDAVVDAGALEGDGADAAVPAHSRRRPRAPRSQLAAETQLLRDVNAAINRGDGAAALALLRSYDQRFRGGSLREERSAARVLALCLTGRTAAAQGEAQKFFARYPRSPLAPRVAGSCAWRKP